MVTQDDLIALATRSDAAVALILALLVHKGLLSNDELNNALDEAEMAALEGQNGRAVASVFLSVREIFASAPEGLAEPLPR